MSSIFTGALLAILGLFAYFASASADSVIYRGLAGDDECRTESNAEHCAVNALQSRALGQMQAGADPEEVSDTDFETALAALPTRGWANSSEEEVAAGGDATLGASFHRKFCAETCWANYGFGVGDCKCSIHGSWYMWICWKRHGVPIKTEYGKQYSCHGLTKGAAPAPAPPVAAPVAAPVATSGSCSKKYVADCRESRCCSDPGYKCYEKNGRWAGCLRSCRPGINWHEPANHRSPWSCKQLEPVPITTTTTTQLKLESSPYHPEYRPKNQKLAKKSSADLMTFHLFRVRSDENHSCCANNDMTSAGAALFYLHNEIVWHPQARSGTYFSTPKTRIGRYKLQVRATQPLRDLGMNFGVMNAFDITRCTGPFECSNFETYGYTVGCENWIRGSPANFPHQEFDETNKYPNAMWYSLPGPCPLGGLNDKSEACKASQPGGQCPPGVVPTGTGDCTYSLEPAGEVTIDELEGIDGYKEFIAAGGREYDPDADQGTHLNFWDGKLDDVLCKNRVQALLKMFDKKYPNDPTIEPPECDFNKYMFFPGKVV